MTRKLYGKPLSPRQLDTLRLVARGLDNNAITERMGIEYSTVRNQVHYIFEKYGVTNRVQAIRHGREVGDLGYTPEQLARRFHEVYEALAPHFGYETQGWQKWKDVPDDNKHLMIAVCRHLLTELYDGEEKGYSLVRVKE